MPTPPLKQIELAEFVSLRLEKKVLDLNQVLDLHEKYGPIDFYRAELNVSQEYWESWYNVLNIKKNRTAEVALYIENADNTILLHTKPFYPPDIFRIPTGGIHPGEHVIDALHRELDEETSFTANSFLLFALLLYQFNYGGRTLPFVSYIFKVKVDGGEPHPKDDSENITGYRWIKTDQLLDVFHQLWNLKERWHDWGVMRSLPHKILSAETIH